MTEVSPVGTTSILPPIDSQNVTVVVSPPDSNRPPRGRRTPWVVGGAVLGLAVGLGLGFAYYTKQPAEYESSARLQVSGSVDPTEEESIIHSPRVLTPAAERLGAYQPFQVPPPASEANRIAFLAGHLYVSGPANDLALAFRGTHPVDAAKCLQAIVEAYRAEVAARSQGAKAPAPSPVPPPVSADAELASIDANVKHLNEKLRQVTAEDLAQVQARLATDRDLLNRLRLEEQGIKRDLARIEATGPDRKDRLATMKVLGIKPDEPVAAPPTQTPALEDTLQALEAKKAELGLRLGPEHRDMVSLDEQIRAVKARIAKQVPAPKKPDELDRRRGELESDLAKLATEIGMLVVTNDRDERVVRAATALRSEIDRLQAARQKAAARPKPPAATATPVVPPAAPVVDVVVPPTEGRRVAPVWYKILPPAALLGLLAGGGLGLLASLAGVRGGPRPPRVSQPTVTVLPPTPGVAPPAKKPARCRTPAEPVPQLGVSVLGRIPPIRTDLPVERKTTEGLSPILASFSRPSGPEAEAFRAARRELTSALQNRGHQVILVTGPDAGDGTSTVAANLAISLAQSGKRVVLVDCDLRSPQVQELFRIPRLGDCLRTVMAAEVDLRMAIRTCEVGNLFLLPAGRGPMDPVDIFTRPKFRELIADLRGSYEYVILDAPPSTAERELRALAGLTDGAVLVVCEGPDAVSRSDRGLEQTVRAGSRVLGAVINTAPTRPQSGPTAPVVPPPEPAKLVPTGRKKD